MRFEATFLSLLAITAYASHDTCETIDGDCPDDCSAAGFDGNHNFVAYLWISPNHLHVENMARKAEKYIKEAGDVTSTMNPEFTLHTSLFYFCCHTREEKRGIEKALHSMTWESFDVEYDSFACNLDHNGEKIYLHALPSNQDDLFALTGKIEDTVKAAGIPINHPRKSMFHMTLARVKYDYPVDDVVNYFLDNKTDWDFGTVTPTFFTIGPHVFHASKSEGAIESLL